MRLLLFLILMKFHYARAQDSCKGEDIRITGSTCNNDKQCVNYNNYKLEGGVYCTSNEGTCCIKHDYCGATRPVLQNSTDDYKPPVLCKEHSHCEVAAKSLKEARTYECLSGVCCATVLAAEDKSCPMAGVNSRTATCTVKGGACYESEYCDVKGCCERKFCLGGHTLPADDPAAVDDKFKFMGCTANSVCEPFHNDSYCSPLEGGGDDKKFCCPIPYSKQFHEKKLFLLPTNILKHHQARPDSLKASLYEHTGEFSKKCTKNSDCGPEEFCDEVTQRHEAYAKNLNNLKNYQPKICFPAPRCGGTAYRDPDATGIRFCDSSTLDCPQGAYCDTQSNNDNPVDAFKNQAFCCKYNCTEDLKAAKEQADEKITVFASYTRNKKQCSVDNDCKPEAHIGGRCVNSKEQGTPIPPLQSPTASTKLCCSFSSKNESEMYRCQTGDATKDTSGRVMKCSKDEECNNVEGKGVAAKEKWSSECVDDEGYGRYCCPVAQCQQGLYMRTENDCKTISDCLKEEEDREAKADARARCIDYHVKNKLKNKKCCPIGEAKLQMPYCTKMKCNRFSDCLHFQYCHPTKKTCCFLGITKLDGKRHENSSVCQDKCNDKEIFGKKVAQYCVQQTDKNAGVCFVDPYAIVEDRRREVNKTYKIILIVSIVLFLVFSFLALIMFVNYRSKNFCDKYTPKKKKKGKKGKKSKSDSGTGGKSEVSGTSGGTSGTKDPTGTSGTGASTGGGDNVSGTGA